MTEPTADRDPIELVCDAFLERYRAGERPAVSEYADRYPALADQIRAVLPALVLMEQNVPSDPSAREAGPEPPLRQLGDYQILREVGRGGMGVVYEAVQQSLGRHVALKVLPGSAGRTPAQLERFRRESRAAARLHHTNIVPVFGVGADGGCHYYAMQFIRGHGLDVVLDEVRRLRGGPPADGAPTATREVSQAAEGLLTGQFEAPAADAPPPAPSGGSSVSELAGQPEARYFREVARLGVQAAEALAYAHSQGILHRDVKPSNLLLDARGTVWVADFGLAKSDDGDDLTGTGDLVGTLRYMAPERFQGRADARSDVYALGVTLYEMLTLRPAFAAADRLKLIDQVTHSSPARPRALDPRIPRDLETIVLKASAAGPADRYASAADLADDLRRFLADRSIRARRFTPPERVWRWGRRNPAVAILSAAVVLLLVGITAWTLAKNSELRTALSESDDHRTRAEGAEREGQARLWVSYLERARVSRLSRQPGQRFAGLRAVRDALQLPVPEGRSLDELRTAAIGCLALADLELAAEIDLPHEAGLDHGAAADLRRSPDVELSTTVFNPTLTHVARADARGTVAVYRLADRAVTAVLPGEGPISSYGLSFSPDGRLLQQRSWPGGRLRVWRLGTGADPPEVVYRGQTGDRTAAVAFTPDGRLIAHPGPDGAVHLVDGRTGRPLRTFHAGAHAHGLAFHPSRPWLAVWVEPGRVVVLDTDSGAVVAAPARLPPIDDAVWHPSGEFMALSTSDQVVHLYDVVADRPVRPPLRGFAHRGIELAFNRAGDRLVTRDWSGLARVWDIEASRQCLTLPNPRPWLAFSPDDRFLGSTADPGRPRLFRFAAGREFRTLRPPDAGGKYSHSVVCCGDRLLAVGSAAGLAFVDRATGERVAYLPVGLMRPFALTDGPRPALLVNGPATGVTRWPVRREGGGYTVGPPDRLPLSGAEDWYGSSADGRVVSCPLPGGTGALVWHRDRPSAPVRLTPQWDVRYTAVSPDGRWVATRSHWGPEGSAWDAATGRRVADLPRKVAELPRGLMAFSPDNRWLYDADEYLVGEGTGRLWSVGDWARPPARLVGAARSGVFSPDGGLLATMTRDVGVIALFDPVTGREVARLTAPDPAVTVPMAFSPDGRTLVACADSEALHVWDLRAIRAGLRELNLDWDAPPDPPPDEGRPGPVGPLRVRIDRGSLAFGPPQQEIDLSTEELRADPGNAAAYYRRGQARWALQQFDAAADDYRAGLRLRPPDSAHACNDIAWQLATGPPRQRDPAVTVPLARRAAELVPDEPLYQNTLGVVLFRAGRPAEAVGPLEKSLARAGGKTDGFDLYFLAMCHHQLHDPTKAAECLRRALAWHRQAGTLSAELAAFRAEVLVRLGWVVPLF